MKHYYQLEIGKLEKKLTLAQTDPEVKKGFIRRRITHVLISLTNPNKNKSKTRCVAAKQVAIIPEITIYGTNYCYGAASEKSVWVREKETDLALSLPLNRDQIFLDAAVFSLRSLGIQECINMIPELQQKNGLRALQNLKIEFSNQLGVEDGKSIEHGFLRACKSIAENIVKEKETVVATKDALKDKIKSLNEEINKLPSETQNFENEIQSLQQTHAKINKQLHTVKKKRNSLIALAPFIICGLVMGMIFTPYLLPFAAATAAVTILGIIAASVIRGTQERLKIDRDENMLEIQRIAREKENISQNLLTKEKEIERIQRDINNPNLERFSKVHDKIKGIVEQTEKAITQIDQAIATINNKEQEKQLSKKAVPDNNRNPVRLSEVPTVFINNLSPEQSSSSTTAENEQSAETESRKNVSYP